MIKKNNLKGFTLIEVLIAMSIITIILLVFFNTLNNTIRMNEKTEKDIQMMDIAQTKIENAIRSIRESEDSVKIEVNSEKLNDGSYRKDLRDANSFSSYTYDMNYNDEENNKYTVTISLDKNNISEGITTSNKDMLSNSYTYNITIKVKSKATFSNREAILKSAVFKMTKKI